MAILPVYLAIKPIIHGNMAEQLLPCISGNIAIGYIAKYSWQYSQEVDNLKIASGTLL